MSPESLSTLRPPQQPPTTANSRKPTTAQTIPPWLLTIRNDPRQPSATLSLHTQPKPSIRLQNFAQPETPRPLFGNLQIAPSFGAFCRAQLNVLLSTAVYSQNSTMAGDSIRDGYNKGWCPLRSPPHQSCDTAPEGIRTPNLRKRENGIFGIITCPVFNGTHFDPQKVFLDTFESPEKNCLRRGRWSSEWLTAHLVNRKSSILPHRPPPPKSTHNCHSHRWNHRSIAEG